MKMAIKFFYHHGSESIFTIGKCGAKLKILKCSKQTLSPFSQQSTLAYVFVLFKKPLIKLRQFKSEFFSPTYAGGGGGE
jgi:hypothetical protein